MYLSTKQFTKALLTAHEDPNQIISALEFLYTMRRRLWRKMETDTYMNEIKKEYPTAYNVWSACMIYGKKKAVQIKQLLRTAKELSNDYTKQFVINTWSEDIESLTKKISKTFDKVAVSTQQNDTPELSIQGEWYYYRRSVDKDVDKLLS